MCYITLLDQMEQWDMNLLWIIYIYMSQGIIDSIVVKQSKATSKYQWVVYKVLSVNVL